MRAVPAFLLLALLLLAGAGCLQDAGTDAPLARNEYGAIAQGSMERSYVIHVPPQASEGRPLPLLVVLHGALANGRLMQAVTGLDAAADEHGFYVAYLDGISPWGDGSWRTWNAGYCCAPARIAKVDDVGFIAQVITLASERFAIDADRVGVLGHSNGAMMAHRFASERSDLVAVVVDVAGAFGGQPDASSPVILPPRAIQPVSALIMHATDDPNVPYQGGVGKGFGEVDPVHLSVRQTVEAWLVADNLTGAYAKWEEDGVQYEGHGTGPGLEVLLVTTRGGHGWPGGADFGGVAVSPRKPDTAALVADFLLGHPKVRPTAPTPAGPDGS